MKLPEPSVGSVIRYSYLWHYEAERRQNESCKERPSLVVSIAMHKEDGQLDVMVLAITHPPPRAISDAVEIPRVICEQLGFDDDAAWIVTIEANAFVWPGPDLRPVPKRRPPGVIYGKIPNWLLKAVAVSYLANRTRGRARLVRRG